MCFSATASMTTAAILLPAGLYCVYLAFSSNKRYLLFALVPVVFAIQQFVEGMVWYYHGNLRTTEMISWSYIYLFFAYAFWPFYISLSTCLVEANQPNKKILKLFVYAGAILGLIIYVPIISGYVPLTVAVIDKSMVYDTYLNEFLIKVYCVAYAFTLIIPLFVATSKGMRLFGWTILGALIASSIWYYYAFTSVWCFFAAVLSLFVLSVLRDVKRNVKKS